MCPAGRPERDDGVEAAAVVLQRAPHVFQADAPQRHRLQVRLLLRPTHSRLSPWCACIFILEKKVCLGLERRESAVLPGPLLSQLYVLCSGYIAFNVVPLLPSHTHDM